MARIISLFIVTFLLLLVGCSQEDTIREKIDTANHCKTSDDCVLVGSKCPFDCYIYAHSSEADKVKTMVDSYQSNCEYSCIRCPSVECVEHKCKPKCE